MQKNSTLLTLIIILPLFISSVWASNLTIENNEGNLQTSSTFRRKSNHGCGCFSIFKTRPPTRQKRAETVVSVAKPVPSANQFHIKNNGPEIQNVNVDEEKTDDHDKNFKKKRVKNECSTNSTKTRRESSGYAETESNNGSVLKPKSPTTSQKIIIDDAPTDYSIGGSSNTNTIIKSLAEK